MTSCQSAWHSAAWYAPKRPTRSSTVSNSGTGVSSMAQPAARRRSTAPRAAASTLASSASHTSVVGSAKRARDRSHPARSGAGRVAGAEAPVEHGEEGCGIGHVMGERADRIHAGAEPERAVERQQPETRLQADEAVPGGRHAHGAARVRADCRRGEAARRGRRRRPRTTRPANAEPSRRRGWAGCPSWGSGRGWRRRTRSGWSCRGRPARRGWRGPEPSRRAAAIRSASASVPWLVTSPALS